MGIEHFALISVAASLIATVFSWLTILRQEWKWYIPTLLFAAISLSAAAFGFSLV